jgi:hypothetical protein
VTISRQICERARAGVVACVLALCGCGSEPDATTGPSRTGTPAHAATPALPGVLRGSWKRTMRARDWRSAGSGYPVGTWRFDVDGRGAVGVYYPRTDTVDFTTQLVVNDQQLTIESIPICPGRTGRYRWRASADALTLTVVGDDACKPRAALFGGTWTRRR